MIANVFAITCSSSATKTFGFTGVDGVSDMLNDSSLEYSTFHCNAIHVRRFTMVL
jgi:hypothetical protein